MYGKGHHELPEPSTGRRFETEEDMHEGRQCYLKLGITLAELKRARCWRQQLEDSVGKCIV